jgi:membrane peptidoglycan carboxypeptidase
MPPPVPGRRFADVVSPSGPIATAPGLVTSSQQGSPFLIAAAAGAPAWVLREAPFPSRAKVASRRVISIVSADGHELFERNHLQLAPIDAKDMPNVVNAVLSIEDWRFYEHGAIDLRSVVRAFRDNWSSGRTVAGAPPAHQHRRAAELGVPDVWPANGALFISARRCSSDRRRPGREDRPRG